MKKYELFKDPTLRAELEGRSWASDCIYKIRCHCMYCLHHHNLAGPRKQGYNHHHSIIVHQCMMYRRWGKRSRIERRLNAETKASLGAKKIRVKSMLDTFAAYKKHKMN